jgi:hypothetical protein
MSHSEPIFIRAGYTDAATIDSSTTSAASAPASNLLTDRRGEFWRTSSAVTTCFAIIDLGALKDVTGVAVIDVEGPETIETTVQIRGADTAAGCVSAPELDNGGDVVPRLVTGKRQISFYDGTTYNIRYIRIDISFSGTAQVLGAGRVMIDDAYVPGNFLSPDSRIVTPGSASDVTETDAGGEFIRHLYTRAVAEPVMLFSRDEYHGDDGLWDLLAFTGTNRPLVFVQDAQLDYGANSTRLSKGILYGRITEQNGVRYEFGDEYGVGLPMTEYN